MEPDQFATVAMVVTTPAVLFMFIDGIGLIRGSGLVHRLGIPFRRGELHLPDALPVDSELPHEPHGPNGIWIDEQTVGYWDGSVRMGFKDSFGFSFLRGMGIASSGTVHIAPDRRTATYVERLRLSPILLFVSVGIVGGWLFSHSGAPVYVNAVPMIGFAAFYAFFAAFTVRHLRDVRKRLGVPL